VLSPTTDYAEDFAAISNPLVCRSAFQIHLRGPSPLRLWRAGSVLPACRVELPWAQTVSRCCAPVPAGVARFGIVQSHDPGPYEVSRLYSRWIDAMIGVSYRNLPAPCPGCRSFLKRGLSTFLTE
jgi:hypothetical protein